MDWRLDYPKCFPMEATRDMVSCPSGWLSTTTSVLDVAMCVENKRYTQNSI